MFKEYDKLPNEETELYEQFVCLTVSRFLQKLEHNPPPAVLSLQDFPEINKKLFIEFVQICF